MDQIINFFTSISTDHYLLGTMLIICIVFYITNCNLYYENLDLKDDLHRVELEINRLHYYVESQKQWLETCKDSLEEANENLIMCKHQAGELWKYIAVDAVIR